MKFLVLFAVLLTSSTGFAEQRVAERYVCTAFNPLTGYASINYSEKSRGVSRMTSLWGEKEIRGGRLTYNTNTASSLPRAIFNVPVNGQNVSVYMDLLRPLRDDCEGQLAEEILTGITYVPIFAATSSWWLFSPVLGLSPNPFLPVPVGFVPTSLVTCRVIFR